MRALHSRASLSESPDCTLASIWPDVPLHTRTGSYTQVVDHIYPEHLRAQGALGFPTFMQIIYEVLAKMGGSGLKGNYAQVSKRETAKPKS